MPVCIRCGVGDKSTRWGGPAQIIAWGRYPKSGKLHRLCPSCDVLFDARKVRNGAAKDAGYLGTFNTPEYKRSQREKTATQAGKPLQPYLRQADRERSAKMLRVEAKAERLRGRWAKTWLKPFRDDYRQSEEYLEAQRIKAKRYYDENTLKERLRKQLYKHSNPEKHMEWGDRRKVRMAEQADGTLTAEVVREMFNVAEVCPYCSVGLDDYNKSLDHIVPVSRDGKHSVLNTLICCRDCNQSKLNRTFLDWARTLHPRNHSIASRLYLQRFKAINTP